MHKTRAQLKKHLLNKYPEGVPLPHILDLLYEGIEILNVMEGEEDWSGLEKAIEELIT